MLPFDGNQRRFEGFRVFAGYGADQLGGQPLPFGRFDDNACQPEDDPAAFCRPPAGSDLQPTGHVVFLTL